MFLLPRPSARMGAPQAAVSCLCVMVMMTRHVIARARLQLSSCVPSAMSSSTKHAKQAGGLSFIALIHNLGA
jgi:hypothetical protein